MELDHGTGGDGELGNGWRRTGEEIKGWMERLLDEKWKGFSIECWRWMRERLDGSISEKGS